MALFGHSKQLFVSISGWRKGRFLARKWCFRTYIYLGKAEDGKTLETNFREVGGHEVVHVEVTQAAILLPLEAKQPSGSLDSLWRKLNTTAPDRSVPLQRNVVGS